MGGRLKKLFIYARTTDKSLDRSFKFGLCHFERDELLFGGETEIAPLQTFIDRNEVKKQHRWCLAVPTLEELCDYIERSFQDVILRDPSVNTSLPHVIDSSTLCQ